MKIRKSKTSEEIGLLKYVLNNLFQMILSRFDTEVKNVYRSINAKTSEVINIMLPQQNEQYFHSLNSLSNFN